jgi:50S ribosomal protein L16 3-hydroxylase
LLRRILRNGVRLDVRTQLLYDDSRYYLNGAEAPLAAPARRALRQLAGRRALTPVECAALSPEVIDMLLDWQRHGFLDDAG